MSQIPILLFGYCIHGLSVNQSEGWAAVTLLCGAAAAITIIKEWTE